MSIKDVFAFIDYRGEALYNHSRIQVRWQVGVGGVITRIVMWQWLSQSVSISCEYIIMYESQVDIYTSQ